MHAAFTILALVASANAYAYNYTTSIAPVYETKYVTDLTTVCPSATVITIGSSLTYTVTEATTLTITDCSCTVTNEIPAATSAAPVESVPAYSTGVVVVPSSAAPYPTAPAGNGTTVVVPVGTATAPVTTTAAPEFTGAASKAGVAALGLAGAALAAFL
jgi:hypothetical protein